MDKGKERDLQQKGKEKAGDAKPDQKQPTADEPRKDPWPPSSGPGERSDKDAIGRPVQLDKD